MKKLREMIMSHEGRVLHGYLDSRGFLTIGYGRMIDDRLKGGITQEEAEYLLDNDIKRCIKEADEYPWFEKLNEPRRAVIISMLFNMGGPRFQGFFKMRRAIEEEDFVEAAAQMMDSKWATQVGHRARELAMMMETGKWLT